MSVMDRDTSRHYPPCILSALTLPLLLWALTLLAPVTGHAASANETAALRIAVRHAPPFAIKTEDDWQGITVDLVRHIANEHGQQIEFVEMGLQQMLEAAATARVDAAAAALTITAEREQRLDFTHPFYTSGLGIAVPQNGIHRSFSLLGGIHAGAFLKSAGALLALLTLVGGLIWLVERRRNSQFPKGPVAGIGSGIWWSAVTMTTVGYGDKAPVTPLGRALGLIWMFASIIMISGFTAAIATSLTVERLDNSIKGIDDLYGKRVLTIESSTSAAFLDQSLIRYQTLPSVQQALEALRQHRADALVYDLPILQHLVQHGYPHDLRVLPNQFARQDYGIALPPGAPYREAFNQDILRLITHAEWRRLLERYLGSLP